MGWIADLRSGSGLGNEFEHITGTDTPVVLDATKPLTLLGNTGAITVTIPDHPTNTIGAVKRLIQLEGSGGQNVTVEPTKLVETGDHKDQLIITEEGGALSFIWTGNDEGWALLDQAGDNASVSVG